MADQKSMLCVGGPRGGKRYAILHGAGFRVPVQVGTTSEAVEIEFADYRAEIFHTPQGDVSFWVPNDQTPLETITMLLEAYERTMGKHGSSK